MRIYRQTKINVFVPDLLYILQRGRAKLRELVQRLRINYIKTIKYCNMMISEYYTLLVTLISTRKFKYKKCWEIRKMTSGIPQQENIWYQRKEKMKMIGCNPCGLYLVEDYRKKTKIMVKPIRSSLRSEFKSFVKIIVQKTKIIN